MMFHSRGSKADFHWSCIRACRLSSHHGEFCKLFCGQTSRDVDFFAEDNMRCGEKLLNMIEMCAAFSTDDDCSLFRDLFDNIHAKMVKDTLPSALNCVKKAAVDTKLWRNKLAHNLLTLDPHSFNLLVTCAQHLLVGICNVFSCLICECEYCVCRDCVEQALSGIKNILERELNVASLSDDQWLILNRHYPRLLEEREQLQELNKSLKQRLSRNYDSFALILKSEIKKQLIESMYARSNVQSSMIQHVDTGTRQSDRNHWGARLCLQSTLLQSTTCCQGV
jgi:hypothetical protein